jgi:hypothetical protein
MKFKEAFENIIFLQESLTKSLLENSPYQQVMKQYWKCKIGKGLPRNQAKT